MCTSAISDLRKLRQDECKLKGSLGRARLGFETNKQKLKQNPTREGEKQKVRKEAGEGRN